MVEALQNKMQNANKVDIYFWMITDDNYEELRKIVGCEGLADLGATKKDGVHIMRLARSLGVPEENMYINNRATIKDLKATYTTLLKLSRKKSAAEIPHIIFVYAGGHGATQSEKQIYLLNTSDPGDAMFQIEFKLRYLVKDQFTSCRVFSVFDCCRVNLQNMPGLAMGRGVAGVDANDDYGSEEEDSLCKYFHIQACGPGGIADADGGFAKRLLDTGIKYSNKEPKGFMEWPRDWSRVRWAPGELCNTGGDDYLVPFNLVPEGATSAGAIKVEETKTAPAQEEEKK